MRDCTDDGFSFVEILIALTIVLAAMAPLLHIAASGHRLARSHSEATDLHQRLRVAVEKLRRDLALAGAGGLTAYLPPLIPGRVGARAPDPPLSAFADRISLVYASDDAGPSPLTVDMATASDAVPDQRHRRRVP